MIYKLTNPFYKKNIKNKKIYINLKNLIFCLFEKVQFVKTFLVYRQL